VSVRVAVVVLALLLPLRSQEPGAGVLTLEAQAQRALKDGKPDVAVEAYLALARSEPDQAKWVIRAVEAMTRGGRFRDALDLLDTAVQKFAGVADAHVELRVLTAKVNMLHAEDLAAAGKRDTHVLFAYEEAAQVAGDVVANSPDNRDARLILAEACFALGKFDDAVTHAQEATKRFPAHPGGHILLAKVAYQRFVEARQRITNEAPKGKDLEELAKEAAAARKQATTAAEAAITADPQRAFPHKLLGDVHAWNDNPGQALLSYGKALSLDPGIAVNHDWLASASEGSALIDLYSKALAEYRKRPDADPRRAAATTWYLGRALFVEKQFAPAREHMRAAYAANAEFSNSLYYVWLASYWLGDHDAAEKEAAQYAQLSAAGFADLLRSLPDRAQTLPILTFLAARAFQAGRLPQSCALNHVVALVENSAQAWNNYAFLCREAGNHHDSLLAYERALELEPDSPQLLNDTAVILHYHLVNPENTARAKSMYERAVALAEAQLGKDGLDPAVKARTEQALKDARANLAKMAGGGG
jgi:tetratricopeptide (TPR) repeat protein